MWAIKATSKTTEGQLPGERGGGGIQGDGRRPGLGGAEAV